MIDLYTFGTPNGRKASIMLEEVGLPYRVHAVNITKGEQMAPEFLAVNPNNKIPAIIDQDGPDGAPYTVFESGAILMYLADKTESPLLPADTRRYFDTVQWLMFQMGGVGPMAGQAHHFRKFAPEPVPYAITRYTDEVARLYRVMDTRLAKVPYLAGDFYSVADVATYPWIDRHEFHGINLADHPNIRRWFETLSARPAVRRGMAVP